MPSPAEQARAAAALVGRRVIFHHRPDDELRVVASTTTGMVRLDRYVGEFSPYLFHVVEDEPLGGADSDPEVANDW